VRAQARSGAGLGLATKLVAQYVKSSLLSGASCSQEYMKISNSRAILN
jgi:hypothetical protein